MYEGFSKVYDRLMEYADYDLWTDCVEKYIKEYCIKAEEVLDLGCGTGELLIRLSERYSVTGVDLSAEMLSVAAKKLEDAGKELELYKQDMRQLRTGKEYDVVISLFDTVNHLRSNLDLEKTFSSVYGNLKKGGIYIFDVVTRQLMDEMFSGGSFVDEREGMFIVWEHEIDDEGLDYVYTNFFVEDEDGRYDRIYEEYSKKIFTHDEVVRYAEKTGFSVEKVEENDILAGARVFYVLKK